MRMKSQSMSFVLLWFAMFEGSFVGANREETVNPDLGKGNTIEILQGLETIITLLLNNADIAEQISEVKANISRMAEGISTFVEDSKSMRELLQKVGDSKSQSRTLNTVLNTVFNINSILEETQKKNSKGLQTIIESLAKSSDGEAGCGHGEICSILEVIFQKMHNITTSQPGPGATPDPKAFEKILELQKESNALVKSFISEAKEVGSLNEELQNITKENQELKAKLQNRKLSIRPADCNDLRIAGVKESGVYEIYPDSCRCGQPIRVWCDMDSEGGGWTLLIARGRGIKHENFTRSWEEYEAGFGHPEAEYWIGTSHLYRMTSSRRYSLRIDVTNKYGISKWGQWDNFEVASPDERYKLSIGDFVLLSSLGNVLSAHHNQHFTTYDVDNDSSFKKNCAQLLKGGWWYAKCYDIHPTGVLNASDVNQGVSTSHFGIKKRGVVPLQTLTMKMKPRMCTYASTVSPSSRLFCQPEDGNF